MRWLLFLAVFIAGAISHYGYHHLLNKPEPVPARYGDIVLHDFNDMSIMQILHRYRQYQLYKNKGRIGRYNFSYYENRGDASRRWAIVKQEILMNPTPEASFYSIYRDMEWNIKRSQTNEPNLTAYNKLHRPQYLVSIMGAAMHLALLEDKEELYFAALDAQNCFIKALTENQDYWPAVEEQCLESIKADVYRLLAIDEDFQVDHTTSPFLPE